MPRNRQLVLAAILAGVLVLAGVVLARVLATVFFAVTVAYLLAPVQRRLVATRLTPVLAGVVVTAAAAVGVLVPLTVAGYLIYRRRDSLFSLLATFPEAFTVEVGRFAYTVTLATLVEQVQAYVSNFAVSLAGLLPVLALKFGVFVLVVFALLVKHRETADALLAPVPDDYHDVALALHERVRETLFAIYVLQAATGAATAVFALPLFAVLGLPFPLTLAFVAGVLQFLPVVGPSVLVVLLAAYQVSVGATVAAALTLVLGLVVVAGLPDLVVRPSLARETADFPGSLYFVGFVGGLLTVGPVGIVAGPLVVALAIEVVDLLAAENGTVVPVDGREEEE